MRSSLAGLLPTDLDAAANPRIISAVGIQCLLFAGFVPTDRGAWVRSLNPPGALSGRVNLVAPTWKIGGRIDYSWKNESFASLDNDDAPLSLFASTNRLLTLPDDGATIMSLVSALDAAGLYASDFDGPAQATLREMLTWKLPPASDRLRLDASAPELTLLVLSFDATPHCYSVTDCARPGPSNELLAATAAEFASRRLMDHGQRVRTIAQWEVAASMRTIGHHATPVGTPGRFENTAEIFAMMRTAMGPCSVGACAAGEEDGIGDGLSRVILLAHPDHLIRALRIGETTFRRAGGDHGGCDHILLVPAMQPYAIDWPAHADLGQGPMGHDHRTSGAKQPRHLARRFRFEERPGALLNLYANVSARVHSGGEVRTAAWSDANHGFFPDGDPQRWTHRREVWVAYETWARAKGVATGIIGL